MQKEKVMKKYFDIKAIIFDMDGVISDTQALHSKVESKLLKEYGINIEPEEITKNYAGVRTKDFMDKLLSKQHKPYDLKEIIQQKWLKMEELAAKSVREVDGAVDLIKMFNAAGFSSAVASASNSNYVEIVLDKLNVRKYFTVVICGDMVRKGKPDPESFLLAAAKLNVLPRNCLVIEDGISGMEAAKRANMQCIGLVKDKKQRYPTKNLVLSLTEITAENFVS